jgi:hypothetical protein
MPYVGCDEQVFRGAIVMWLKVRSGIAAGIFATALTISALAVSAPAIAADRLAAGATVPTFTATDQAGGMRNLATLTPNKGVVLLFTRSLHW